MAGALPVFVRYWVLEEAIYRRYRVDFFLILQNSEKPMTATEVAELQPEDAVSADEQFGSEFGSDFGVPEGMEMGVEGGVVGGIPGGVLGGVLGRFFTMA